MLFNAVHLCHFAKSAPNFDDKPKKKKKTRENEAVPDYQRARIV